MCGGYRLLVRVVGVARGYGFVRAVLRTGIVLSLAIAGVGDAPGYFTVVGQIRRQGCVFTVSLNCLMFSPAGPAGTDTAAHPGSPQATPSQPMEQPPQDAAQQSPPITSSEPEPESRKKFSKSYGP